MTKEQLAQRDFYLLIDKSGSMADPVKANSTVTRWQETQEATVGLARWAEQYDNDGISVVLFANNHQLFNNITSGGNVVKDLFTNNGPNGGTNTLGALQSVIDDYFVRKAANAGETKKLIIFCVTDGIPNGGAQGEKELATWIEGISNRVEDADEIRINFVQVGDDQHAKEFLNRLDNDLNGKFDIVNSKSEDEISNYPSLNAAIEAMVNDLAEAPVVAKNG